MGASLGGSLWRVRRKMTLKSFTAYRLLGVLVALLTGGGGAVAWVAEASGGSPQPQTQPSPALPRMVWPISGQAAPDYPQSSAYGPRQKASEGFRYDYHQGIDLPTPLSTTLVAVLTGTVRIAGSHPAYSDGVVQLDHGNNLYSNYLHVAASLVTTGQVVGIGQPVALSGAAESGFPHLHFELRAGSALRQDAVNPWRYLPYTDTVRHTLTITGVTSPNMVWVFATTPAEELDLNQITMTVRSRPAWQIVDTVSLDYEARNRQYAGDPAQLDNPDLDNILVQSAVFTSTASVYGVSVGFHHLAGYGPVQIEACAVDVQQHAVCATAEAEFQLQIYLPLVVSGAQ